MIFLSYILFKCWYMDKTHLQLLCYRDHFSDHLIISGQSWMYGNYHCLPILCISHVEGNCLYRCLLWRDFRNTTHTFLIPIWLQIRNIACMADCDAYNLSILRRDPFMLYHVSYIKHVWLISLVWNRLF